MNNKISFLAATLLTAGAALMASPAQAVTFHYDWTEADGLYENGQKVLSVNDRQGDYDAVSVSYDDNSSLLSWSSSFTQVGNHQIDGGWLVLSDGPNPKQHDKEFAIFYLDASDVNDTKLTAYAYNGQNSSNSWKSNEFLGSWDNAIQVEDNGDERTISFELDASGLNAADVSDSWKGAQFGENIGIWFHAGNRTNAEYNADGSLSSFNTKAAWFDNTKAMETTAVPEPMTTAGLALMGGVFFARRRKG